MEQHEGEEPKPSTVAAVDTTQNYEDEAGGVRRVVDVHQTQQILLKRNPHLRAHLPDHGAFNSPGAAGGFAVLGSRELVQKQLVAPGSATSSSSFEDQASYESFSGGESTPSSITSNLPMPMTVRVSSDVSDGSSQTSTVESENYTFRQGKPTKRLSSSSRRQLTRRLIDSEGSVDSLAVDTDAGSVGSSGDDVPRSPRSSGRTVVTRRMLSPPRVVKRMIVRRHIVPGSGGSTPQETVEYLSSDDGEDREAGAAAGGYSAEQLQEGEYTTTTNVDGRTIVTRRVVTPGQVVKRVVVRRRGTASASGSASESGDDAQYRTSESLSESGEMVARMSGYSSDELAGGEYTTTTNVDGRTIVTRRIVSPGQVVKRVVVRRRGGAGAGSESQEVAQYATSESQAIETVQGEEVAAASSEYSEEKLASVESSTTTTTTSSSGETVVTRRVVSPGQVIKRVVVRRQGGAGTAGIATDAQDDVEYVTSEAQTTSVQGDEVVTAHSEEELARSEMTTTTTEGGRTVVTRRIVSPGQVVKRVVVRRQGTAGSASDAQEDVQYVTSDSQSVEAIEDATITTTGEQLAGEEYTTTTSGSGQTVVTRVASPGQVVKRVVVRREVTGGAASPASEVSVESQSQSTVTGQLEEQVVEGDYVTQASTPGRTVVTRRIVSPGQVVKRVIVRRQGAGGEAEPTSEAHEDVQYLSEPVGGSEIVTSTTTGYSEEEQAVEEYSESTSSPARTTVTRRVVTPGQTVKRVVMRRHGVTGAGDSASESQEGVEYVTSVSQTLEAGDDEVAADSEEKLTGDEFMTVVDSASQTVVTQRVVRGQDVIGAAGSSSADGSVRVEELEVQQQQIAAVTDEEKTSAVITDLSAGALASGTEINQPTTTVSESTTISDSTTGTEVSVFATRSQQPQTIRIEEERLVHSSDATAATETVATTVETEVENALEAGPAVTESVEMTPGAISREQQTVVVTTSIATTQLAAAAPSSNLEQVTVVKSSTTAAHDEYPVGKDGVSEIVVETGSSVLGGVDEERGHGVSKKLARDAELSAFATETEVQGVRAETPEIEEKRHRKSIGGGFWNFWSKPGSDESEEVSELTAKQQTPHEEATVEVVGVAGSAIGEQVVRTSQAIRANEDAAPAVVAAVEQIEVIESTKTTVAVQKDHSDAFTDVPESIEKPSHDDCDMPVEQQHDVISTTVTIHSVDETAETAVDEDISEQVVVTTKYTETEHDESPVDTNKDIVETEVTELHIAETELDQSAITVTGVATIAAAAAAVVELESTSADDVHVEEFEIRQQSGAIRGESIVSEEHAGQATGDSAVGLSAEGVVTTGVVSAPVSDTAAKVENEEFEEKHQRKSSGGGFWNFWGKQHSETSDNQPQNPSNEPETTAAATASVVVSSAVAESQMERPGTVVESERRLVEAPATDASTERTEVVETIETIEAVETIKVAETIETFETIKAVETIKAGDTIDTSRGELLTQVVEVNEELTAPVAFDGRRESFEHQHDEVLPVENDEVEVSESESSFAGVAVTMTETIVTLSEPVTATEDVSTVSKTNGAEAGSVDGQGVTESPSTKNKSGGRWNFWSKQETSEAEVEREQDHQAPDAIATAATAASIVTTSTTAMPVDESVVGSTIVIGETEETEVIEVIKESEETEVIEETKKTEVTEVVEEIEEIEEIKKTEETETTEETEVIEKAEVTEVIEKMEVTEKSEETEVIETSKMVEETEVTEQTEVVESVTTVATPNSSDEVDADSAGTTDAEVLEVSTAEVPRTERASWSEEQYIVTTTQATTVERRGSDVDQPLEASRGTEEDAVIVSSAVADVAPAPVAIRSSEEVNESESISSPKSDRAAEVAAVAISAVGAVAIATAVAATAVTEGGHVSVEEQPHTIADDAADNGRSSTGAVGPAVEQATPADLPSGANELTTVTASELPVTSNAVETKDGAEQGRHKSKSSGGFWGFFSRKDSKQVDESEEQVEAAIAAASAVSTLPTSADSAVQSNPVEVQRESDLEVAAETVLATTSGAVAVGDADESVVIEERVTVEHIQRYQADQDTEQLSGEEEQSEPRLVVPVASSAEIEEIEEVEEEEPEEELRASSSDVRFGPIAGQWNFWSSSQSNIRLSTDSTDQFERSSELNAANATSRDGEDTNDVEEKRDVVEESVAVGAAVVDTVEVVAAVDETIVDETVSTLEADAHDAQAETDAAEKETASGRTTRGGSSWGLWATSTHVIRSDHITETQSIETIRVVEEGTTVVTEQHTHNASHQTEVDVSKPTGNIRDSDRRTTLLIDDAGNPSMMSDDHYVQIESPVAADVLEEEQVEPAVVEWRKLWLKRRSERGEEKTVLLSDVNGQARPGEFLVITGPSKSESAALLESLAGFHDTVEGTITVNDQPLNKVPHGCIAFIAREDIFYETLTVQEHLVFQARQRLHRASSAAYCLERVEAVVQELDLESCRHKLIGGDDIIGLSAEQRKRVALATALLMNPSVLLVEEPTDGLSTFMAEAIVAALRRMAFAGRTVIVTLHHPSSHCFQFFSTLYLLAESSCVYHGKASECVSYFGALGYQCPDFTSPIDYVLYLLSIGDQDDEREGASRVEQFKLEWAKQNSEQLVITGGDVPESSSAAKDASELHYARLGCCVQLVLHFTRHFVTFWRYRMRLVRYFVLMLIIGIVFGLVFLQLNLNDQKSIQTYAGAFFYAIVVQMMLTAYWNFMFIPREAAIAIREYREYRGNWYYLASWFFARVVVGLFWLLLFSIVLFVPMYLLIGIGHGFKVYFYMQVIMLMAGWAATSLVLLALFVCSYLVLALLIFAGLFVLFVAFGGLIIDVSDIPDYLIWLHYISPVKYSYEALMTVYWRHVGDFTCDETTQECIGHTGEQVLEFYSLDDRSALTSSLILFGVCIAIFVIAFVFWVVLAGARKRQFEWRFTSRYRNVWTRRMARFTRSAKTLKVSERRSRGSKQSEADGATDTNNHYIDVETPRATIKNFCSAERITLAWRGLVLDQQVANEETGKAETRSVLDDASGSAKFGEVLLMTGPSSLEARALLMSFSRGGSELKGKVTLNGIERSSQTAGYFALVARDEAFLESLSVQEHLEFQARARLGQSSACCCYADADAMERVEGVIEELDLSACRFAIIQYLTLAERKRLAIATALLTHPSVLLVDEPTLGMDSYSAEHVVLKLRQLARSGRTVIVSMEHPSSHEFGLFDSLYLMASGSAVYHGRVSEAVEYFSSLGFVCPQYTSPVDYFVRQLTVGDDDSSAARLKLFKDTWAVRYSERSRVSETTSVEGDAAQLSHRSAPRLGWCAQFSLLFSRHVRYMIGYRYSLWWYLVWTLVVGIVFGLIFLQLDLENQKDIRNYAGAFFFAIVLQMVLISVRTFASLAKELRVVYREHRGGWYYLICWYFTRMVADLPALIVLSIAFFLPAYLLIGVGHGVRMYIYMQLVVIAAGWSAAGLVFLCLSLLRRVYIVVVIYTLIMLLFVVFGGLLVNVSDAPDYLIWIHYISPVKFGYESLMKLFWAKIGAIACNEDESEAGCIGRSGDDVLEYYSMESRSARGDAVILVELALLYFFIGYVFLSLRLRRERRRSH